MVASDAASRGKLDNTVGGTSTRSPYAFTPEKTRQDSHFEMTSPLNRLRNPEAARCKLNKAGSSLRTPYAFNQKGAAVTMYGGDEGGEDGDDGHGGGSGGGSGTSTKPHRLGDQSKSLANSGKVASWCVDDLDDLGLDDDVLDAQPTAASGAARSHDGSRMSASGSVDRARRALRLTSTERPSPSSGVSLGAASAQHIRGGGGAARVPARKGVSFSEREVSGAGSAPGSSIADDASVEDNADGTVGGSFLGILPGARGLRGVSAFISPGDSRSTAAHHEPRTSEIGERGSGVGPFMVSMQVR